MVEKGETVWVQFAGKNEEPATVIEELNVEPGEAASLSEEKKDYSGTGDILVRTFDGVEVLVSKDKCRFLGRTGQRNNVRRSTRGIANKPLLGSTAQGAKEKGTPMVMDLQQARSIAEESEDEGFDDMSLAQIKEKSDSKKGVAVKTDERKRKSCKGEPSKPDQEECEFEGASAKKRRKSKSIPKRKQVEMKDPSSPFFESKAKKIVKETVTNEKKFGGDTRKKAKRDGTAESELTATKKKAGRAKTKRNYKDEPGRSPSSRKAGLIDGNGGLDQGASYVIEQAKTSRSTCKRCDIRINKGTLRVGHRPLFRGKPGYQVFKHLECAIFSEDITRAEDVAGCEFLGDEDYDALTRRVEESLEEIQAEKEELEPDELVQKQFDGEKRPSPKGLIANLLPFQEEGTSWMYSQEKDVDGVRGGILADEMGMGKTLQTISTILDNRPRLQRCIPGGKYPPCTSEERKDIDIEEKLWAKAKKEWLYEMKMNDVVDSLLPKSSKKGEPEGGARSGTLIVCPLIALSQWRSEIDKFCESNALSVCIYHGPDRLKIIPRNMMVKYDIVLTTYQVLEADFRKMTSPNKVKCPNCGGKFKVDKLRVHLKYFCGEGAQRTEAQSRTIRNSERGNGDEFRRRRASNSSNGSRGKGKNPKGKKSSKVTKAGSKSFKIDLSFKEEDALVKKSPRNAAVKARRRLKSFRESTPESDDENFSLDSDSDGCSDDFDDDDVCYSSEEDVVMKKAVAKQAEAMKTVKAGKKKFSKGKVTEKKNMNKIGAKKGGKKGKASGLDESASDNDSEDDDIGIDMDALAAEAMAGASMSNLHSVCWWRVILDEAHMIKSRSSQTSHAAFALTGIHRWCLSGTPLQNRVGEFYSLIRFLRLDPMAHYLCRAKGCDCKQIHYRMMNGICRSCGHGSVQHYSHFNRHILNPIQRDGYCHDGRRAMFCLKNEVLDKCLLRRTKETRAEEMNLPPRVVTIKAVRLHPVEEDFYNALYTQTTSSFTDYVTSGTLLNNYAHIFDLLMRMRQSVAHPYLVIHSKKGLGTENTSPAVSNGRIDCHLCNEPPSERVISTCCETAFCKSCVLDYMEMSSGAGAGAGAVTQCPQCNEPFTIDLNQIQEDSNEMDSLQNGKEEAISTLGLPSLKELHHVATGSILRKIDLTKFATSTKIEALTQELVEMRKTSPGSKAIIFSQFVNMLDLIRWRLHSDPFLSDIGLGARALHGGMDVKSRDEALKEFREDPNVRVLLMSLKAGGVALNLTVANYVYLMDPWWNPAAELQAIDRTHRLGQYRPIRAVRFIAENTVEERILQLQEKKRLVFDGTVGRDAGSLKMLTVDDMKSLFA